MKRKYSICLGISAIYNIAYCILIFYANGQAYDATVTTTDNPFEQLGAGIGSTLIYLHLFVIAIASIFVIVAFFMRSFGFSITAGVLYSLSWIVMPMLILFVIPSVVLTFVGAVFCKKYKEEQLDQKEEAQFRKTHPKKEKNTHAASGYQANALNQSQPVTEDLSFQSRRSAYVQAQGYQPQQAMMNPMMQGQDPYAPMNPMDFGATPMMNMGMMNEGMNNQMMMGQAPINQTQMNMNPIVNQGMNAYQMNQTNAMNSLNTGMPTINYVNDPYQNQMNLYNDPMAAYGQTMSPMAQVTATYDPSWNAMNTMNVMQGSPAPSETPKISEGYFDDFGNFHPV